MTNITEADTYDATISVPDNGEKVIAVSATDPPPVGEGPVKPAFQRLTNRTKYLWTRLMGALAGTRVFKQLQLDLTATAGDAAAALAADVAASLKAAADKVLIFSSIDGFKITFGTATITLYPGGTSTLSGGELDINSATGDITVHKGGLVAFTSVTTGANGSNPDRTVNIPNQLRAAMIPKGWGNVITDGSNGITGTGAGGWTPTIVGTAIRLTFSGTITNQCLLIQEVASNVIRAKRTNSGAAFADITCYDAGGAAIDPAAVIVSFEFLMMGKMTT